jgi:mannose-6-phosphate isomerase
MAIERARVQAFPRPWGVVDLAPWSNVAHDGVPIGEIWYERPEGPVPSPSLLLKLLFTSEPLSIQVHPDDAYAQTMGLPNGKTEAWYVVPRRSAPRYCDGCHHTIGVTISDFATVQRSNATFRLFDYGRERELHIERAIAVAIAGPARFRVRPNRFTVRSRESYRPGLK